MKLRENWLEILIVVGILLSIVAAFYMTRGLQGLEAKLVGLAGQEVEVQEFIQRYPGSEPHLVRIAPKGIFSLKEGEALDPYFGQYEDDPLVVIIKAHEFDSAFPDLWIIAYSPEGIQSRGYVAPHPPNPAAYVFFSGERKILFVEVVE